MNNFEFKSDTNILTLSCKLLMFKAKKWPQFFSEVGGCFFFDLRTFPEDVIKLL